MVLKTPYLVAEPPPTRAAVLVSSKYSLFAYVLSGVRRIQYHLEKEGNNPAVYERFSAPGNCYFGDCCICNISNIGELAMYDTLFTLENETAFQASMQRIYEVTSCTGQVALAKYLNIRQSILSDAKRRLFIPPNILLILLFKLSINPTWIITGQSGKYLQACENLASL